MAGKLGKWSLHHVFDTKERAEEVARYQKRGSSPGYMTKVVKTKKGWALYWRTTEWFVSQDIPRTSKKPKLLF